MKCSFLLFTILLTFSRVTVAQQEQKLVGDWKGYISAHGQHLIIKTHFKKQGSGIFGTIDIPQQNGKGLHLRKITVTKEDSVLFQFQLNVGSGKFKGHFKTDSTITGSYHQNGLSFPFKLIRYKAKGKKEKLKQKPYRHKDVIIQKNDSIQIGGTLTWPEKKKTDQLVIMITGSGEQTRDENVFGYKIFGRIADYLTRHGIATYRYDDRGIGESTGNFRQTGIDKLASDVRAIVTYFSSHPHPSFSDITILGHSQGGYVGTKMAAQDSLVDGLILMSSPGVPMAKIVLAQVGPRHVGMEKAILDTLRGSRDFSHLNDSLVKIDLKNFQQKPNNVKSRIKHPRKYFYKKENQEHKIMEMPFYYSFLDYNPAKDLSELHIPVLVLFGSKDIQVPVGLNIKPMIAALDSADVSYQIDVFKNANHLYQKAKTGLPSEYRILPPKFVKGFLPTITQWIKRTETKK